MFLVKRRSDIYFSGDDSQPNQGKGKGVIEIPGEIVPDQHSLS